jgi:nitrate reductase (NAD(P)H)
MPILQTRELPIAPMFLVHVVVNVTDSCAYASFRWIPRDPRILRLTGRHPLNCEPPMDVLMSYGFITPPSVHYVRSHGPVRTECLCVLEMFTM